MTLRPYAPPTVVELDQPLTMLDGELLEHVVRVFSSLVDYDRATRAPSDTAGRDLDKRTLAALKTLTTDETDPRGRKATRSPELRAVEPVATTSET